MRAIREDFFFLLFRQAEKSEGADYMQGRVIRAKIRYSVAGMELSETPKASSFKPNKVVSRLHGPLKSAFQQQKRSMRDST